MASNSTQPIPNESTNGDDSSNNKANVQQQQQLEEKRGKRRERNHRRKEKKRELRLKTAAYQATTTNGTLTPSVSSLDTQPLWLCSPSAIRSTNVYRLSEVQKALDGVDKSFFGGSSAGEMKDTGIGEMVYGSGDSPTCAEVNAMGGGPWPADSKRRRGPMPDDATKKAKVSTLSEGVGLETNSAHPSTPMANNASQAPSTSTINLASQAPIWTPEFFVGGNPRTGPLRADQSAFTDEVAVGLAYGSRLPADKAYFAQCKDAWEIYTHAAKCLAGAIGATTELHNRATMLRPSTVETDSCVNRLEVQLASKNSELDEASKKIKKQAEKIANQARHIEGLTSSYQHLKKNLAEKDEQCKMVSQLYVDECHRYQALCSQYSQLQHEKKEQEDSHTNAVARLAQEKLLAVQSSGKRILAILGVSFQNYQTKCRAMIQANENQFGLEGEYAPLIPFLESECVATDMMRNREEDGGSKGRGCSREVSDKANGVDVLSSEAVDVAVTPKEVSRLS